MAAKPADARRTTPIRAFFAGLGRCSRALAALAMVLIGALIVIVVADVVVRSAGLRPLAWASTTAEYILLYAAFLPMPALVRGKGHVFVEFLRIGLNPTMRRLAEQAVYLVCIVICAWLGWIATAGVVRGWIDGSYETRTFDVPSWLIYLPIALGFVLSALEWLRLLLGEDSMYRIDPGAREGY